MSKQKLFTAKMIITILVIIVVTIVAYGADTTTEQLNTEEPIIVEEQVTQESVFVPELVVKFTKSNVNMRENPAIDANIICVIDRGSTVVVDYSCDGWSKIKYNGMDGYVGSDLLLTEEQWVEWSTVPYTDQIPLTEDLQKYLWNECHDLGIDYGLALAVIDVETGGTFRYDLISKTNDWGIMQINKGNHHIYIEKGWITCSEDLLNPYNGIHCGLDFLSQYIYKYGNCERAYASYNSGKAIMHTAASRKMVKNWEKWNTILSEINNERVDG